MMRMDNETYRIRVQDLLGKLVNDEGQWDSEVRQRLEELAAQPRRIRYFLKALNDAPRDVQVHFYRLAMARAQAKDVVSDLERHIRQRFYESRDEIKAIIAALDDTRSILAVFRVIAHTAEGWLAGELIRLMLAHDPEKLEAPIREALQSGDYLLQCLGIYLVSKSRDDRLLRVLTEFYRKPFGEKLDRLEKKSLDALKEGQAVCSEELILEWLRDGSARVRSLGVAAAEARRLGAAVSDLVRLLLIDSKTRVQAAGALLELERQGIASFNPGAEESAGAKAIVSQAKQGPLVATLKDLLRDDSAAVREAAAKLSRLVPSPKELLPQLSRLATEERIREVQAAALETLAQLDKERLISAMVEIFTESQGAGRHQEVVDLANRLVADVLETKERERLEAEVETKLKKREAALEKFGGGVEWWRHDL